MIEKKNLIEKILQDRRKLLSENKSEKTNGKEKDFLQSPEDNWDDIVNKEVLNAENKGTNNLDDQVYSNLSKINKFFVYNSDSKVTINQNLDLQNSKKVNFEPNFANSSDSKFNKDQNYYKKLKNK